MDSNDIELVARLFKFYNVVTFLELVKAQDYQIEKLQKELDVTKANKVYSGYGVINNQAAAPLRQG